MPTGNILQLIEVVGLFGGMIVFVYTTFATIGYVDKSISSAKEHANLKQESIETMLEEIKTTLKDIQSQINNLHSYKHK